MELAVPAPAQGTLLGQPGAMEDRPTVPEKEERTPAVNSSLSLPSPPPSPVPPNSLLFPYVTFTVASIEGRWTGTEGAQDTGPSIQAASFIKQLT